MSDYYELMLSIILYSLLLFLLGYLIGRAKGCWNSYQKGRFDGMEWMKHHILSITSNCPDNKGNE